MPSTPIYTHVCPSVSDDRGNHVKGCGKGWTSSRFDDVCTTCGDPGQIRGQYMSIDVRAAA